MDHPHLDLHPRNKFRSTFQSAGLHYSFRASELIPGKMEKILLSLCL